MRRTFTFLRVAAATIITLVVIDPLPLFALAETKTIEAEATYIMGDGESPAFAESMALQNAKQAALEQAGTYVESYTKIQNLDLTTEEIQTIAGGVLEVEVLDKTRTLVGDALRFYVKIKTSVTTDKMEDLARRIKGKNVAQEYERLQKDYARLNKEMESLKALVAKTPQGPEREGALGRILEQEKALTELQRSEKVFFKRLFAGETLVQESYDNTERIDRLFQEIRDHGHIVEIGKPVSHPYKFPWTENVGPTEFAIFGEKWLKAVKGVVTTEEFRKAAPPKRAELLTERLRQEVPGLAQAKPKDLQKLLRPTLSMDIALLNARLDDKLFEWQLQNQAKLEVTFPMTVSISQSSLINIRSVADSFGGRMYPVPPRGGILSAKFADPSPLPPVIRYFVPDIMYLKLKFQTEKEPFSARYYDGNIYERRLAGTMILLSSSEDINRRFRERVRKLTLLVRLSFSDGYERTCKAPFVVTRVLPVEEYYTDLAPVGLRRNAFVTSPYHDLTPNDLTYPIDWHELRDFVSYVGVLSDPISFRVNLVLPEQRVKDLNGVEGKFIELESRKDLGKDVCLTVIDNN